MDICLAREFFYVTLFAICIAYTITIIVLNKNKKEERKLEEYRIHVQTNIGDSIPTMLETIVQECFNEYIVLNVEYKDIQYIDSETETKIAKEVASMVAQRISPAMLSKMSLYYKSDSIPNIISEKIYLLVLNYSVNKNTIKNN